jgi:hypothetical protein
METKTENLTAQQSLDLISTMINQTQSNLTQSSIYFLLWGWVIAICNLGMYLLSRFTDFQYPYAIWLLTIPAWIITLFIGNKRSKSSMVKTHLDSINMWLWIALAISICPTILFGAKIGWMINAVVLMPIGLCTFVSGILLRFKPLIVGGITIWIAGTLCHLVAPIDQYLVGALAMILGYLVPGYMLRASKN